jgi:hypothetical protein
METFLKNFTDPSIEMDEDCTLKVKFDAAREVEFRCSFWDSFLFSAYRDGDRYGAIYGYAFIYFSCLGHCPAFAILISGVNQFFCFRCPSFFLPGSSSIAVEMFFLVLIRDFQSFKQIVPMLLGFPIRQSMGSLYA